MLAPVAAQSQMHVRSVLDLIGNTPLLGFKRVTASVEPVQVYAKAEWYNPGGSVKDRAAMNMVLAGEASGEMTHDKVLIDATSGNTGIAYAMIAAERGYRCALALPSNASRERKQTLQAYGAQLILTDPTEGTDGAQRVVKKLVAENPGKYFYPDQYNNPANWQAHYHGTAMEIWRQTGGRITHFVTGLGTTGTFTGTSRRLHELNPAIKCISMQPNDSLHGLEGLKHLPTALVPGIYDPAVADGQVEVDTEDAHRMAFRLAREEGLFVGVSAAANMVAAMQVAKTLTEGVVVTIFSDSAAQYLSDNFWAELASEADNWP